MTTIVAWSDAVNASVVAVIGGAVATVTVGLLVAGWRFGMALRDEIRNTRDETSAKLGSPNGHGDISEMLAKLLGGQIDPNEVIGNPADWAQRMAAWTGGEAFPISTLTTHSMASIGEPCTDFDEWTHWAGFA